MSEASVAAFWEERRAEDATLPPQVPEAWPFGATPAHADELLALVLTGLLLSAAALALAAPLLALVAVLALLL